MTARRPRIVINALSARSGGGVTYTGNLLRHLERGVDADVTVLVGPGQKSLLPESPATLVECDFAGRSVLHRAVWERFAAGRLLRDLDADVHYVLSGSLAAEPPPGCRSVVGFRNLLPFSPEHRTLYPPGYIRSRLWLLHFTQRRSFARADLVIFISQHGRDVIDRAVPERRGRSVTIRHGVSDAFFAGDGAEWNARYPEGYVLYPSILDVYKAQEEVVEAWAAVRARRRTPEKLLLAGPEFPPYGRRVRRRIAELGLEGEVILLGAVRHAELPSLYRGAKLNVFASRCENCPNILLEALAAGRPIVCSSDPPMPEFGADAVVYFDPQRPEELAEHLLELLDDESQRERLAEKAALHAEDFRLEKAMRRTWDVLLELAAEARAAKDAAGADHG